MGERGREVAQSENVEAAGTVEERRSTTSLRISTNSNERVLDSGMPSSPDVIP